ncbi:MAG: hypothetical protein AAFR47_08915, partial [Pseudomonadota bacterium]
MSFRSWATAALCALGLIFGAVAASAQKAGGTLVYIVQPEPPSLASFLSTSGPIGLVDEDPSQEKMVAAILSLAEKLDV